MKTHKQICSFLVTLALCCLMFSPAQAQFIQQGSKLVGTGAVGVPLQGTSVSISADANTIIVGGYNDNSGAGAAWVYTKSVGVWTQQGSKLVGTGAAGNAHQGFVSLSADGNTAIVGGLTDNSNVGAVWAFTRTAGVWDQQGSKLVGTGAVGNSEQGVAVSLSADGNTAIVGGQNDNSSAGAAWVYTRSAGVWTQQGSKLVGTAAVGSSLYQGCSVSLSADGNTAIVGGYGDNGGVGATWVYTRSAGVWTQQGSKLVGTTAVGNSFQGYSVSLSADGNTAIVGGQNDNSQAGATWVFTRSAGVWTQQGSKLVGTGAVGNAAQGFVSISADGNTAIVGGPNDNSQAGAMWVYTRSAGVWSQQGSKLIGTGAVGNAQQGGSISLSADGRTAIVGGQSDNSSLGAVWVYYDKPKPVMSSITDVPHDQGGKVRIKWNRFASDTVTSPASSDQITSYGIWRKVPPGSTAKLYAPGIMSVTNDTLGTLYDFLGTVPAVQSPQYNFVGSTLGDSSQSGTHAETFLLTAHTSDPNTFWISDADTGYSVDNLAPIPPAGIVVSIQSGPQVKLSWNSPTDPDIKSYVIYRSSTSSFTPAPGNSIGISLSTDFTDASPIAGIPSYYRIIAVDLHDNGSLPSAEILAKVPVTRQFSVQNTWNMVSVPLIVSDYAKTVLFPTAASNAFAYDGAYVGYGVLANGRAYWIKFSSAQAVPIVGLELMHDTVNVVEGWNMIGSLSTSVSVSSVGSVPGGIITSNFFGYNGSYKASTTIEPGQGYWVKVSQAGLLVLSSSGNIPSTSRIRIEDKGEVPPIPPQGVTSAVPEVYKLEQNFPNPFNPSTSIKYDLPQQSEVTLEIFNTLGERIAVLVDRQLEAGFHEATWNSSAVPSGVYFYRISAHNGLGFFTDMKKMVLLK